MKKKSTARPGTLRRVLHYIGHTKGVLVLSLLFSLLVVVSTLGIPYCIGLAIDAITKSAPDWSGVLYHLGIALILTLLGTASHFALDFTNKRAVYSVLHRIRRDAMAKINRLPLSYLDRRTTGDTLSRVIGDADQFTDGLLMGFSQLFTGVLTILGTLAFMLTINLPMTLWVVLVTPLSLFVASRIAKSTHDMFKKQAEIRAEQTALVEEMIGSHKAVVAFSHEDEALETFDDINGRLETVSRRAVFIHLQPDVLRVE